MTTLATRKKEIEALEGFAIQIFEGSGKLADLTTQGLPAYGFARKAAGSMVVITWRNSRFQQSYPGYTCEILNKDRTVAHGNTLLEKVR